MPSDRKPVLPDEPLFDAETRSDCAALVRKYGVGTKWIRVNRKVYYAKTVYGFAGLIQSKEGPWHLYYNDQAGRVVDHEQDDDGCTWHNATEAKWYLRAKWDLRPGWDE